jgi:nickel-dependent lactate racemase
MWNVTLLQMAGAAEMTDRAAIEKAINSPVGTPTIGDIARGKHDAVIAIDDISRSTRLEGILDVVLAELNGAGIADEKITIIAALGGHRPMTRQDFIKKIGITILNRVNVANHSPFLNLVKVGVSKLGTPVLVNKTYLNASVKIAVGGVIPHFLAGYGGGAKIILPGLCGFETLEANHRVALKSGAGLGLGIITELRKDIEDACAMAGLDLSINVVANAEGRNAGIFAGHYIEAHRKAIEFSRDVYKTEIPKGARFNVGFFNAFPEDTELNQCMKALNLFMLNSAIIDRKGAVVIMTASSEGRGYHALLAEDGSPLAIKDSISMATSFMGRRKFCLFSPNVTRADVQQFFPGSVLFKNTFAGLIDDLEQVVGKNPSACVFQNSMQMPRLDGQNV